ncbi:MAG: aldo/keto reductase [Oscillospiraceae bacterium]|jgi:predicted aldo/keto reductase-like oxidoreductase|nr:aldo/keto reductase [Oscillospiraceae bacterium]
MSTVKISDTGIEVNKNGFGALPIQRISADEAVGLLRRAYDGGITYFDTARAYSDSETKLGMAFEGMREKIYIATKCFASDTEGFWNQLRKSLAELRTDYVDFYQFHNPERAYEPGDCTGMYEAALEAKRQGLIRHIGFTNHRLAVAKLALESGLYEIIQYPVSFLSSEAELDFVRDAGEKNITIIGMKSLAGGLITNARAAYGFASRFPNLLPIWGVQRAGELEEFLEYVKNPPELDEALLREIEEDKAQLGGDFCRGCGYCLPCPAGIDIPTCARMSLLLRRAPNAWYLSEEWAENMGKIEACVACGHCAQCCPYSLDTPALLRANLADYRNFKR